MNRKRILRLTLVALVTLATGFLIVALHWKTAAGFQLSNPPVPDQIFAPGSLVEPDQLAGTLSQSKEKPPIVCVGFKVLYEGAHIPGALYLGPARTDEGLDTLRKWAENLPRKKTVVIYCGCCPWEKCPNIRPAYSALQKMGFTNIEVLHVSQDFAKDWVEKGFPTDKAPPDQSPQKTN
jgi:thiosulfate/3-mercaptopyruvate sulfurtransferase